MGLGLGLDARLGSRWRLDRGCRRRGGDRGAFRGCLVQGWGDRDLPGGQRGDADADRADCEDSDEGAAIHERSGWRAYPGGPSAQDWYDLGFECVDVDLPAAAIPVLRAGMQAHPGDPNLVIELAVALGQTGQHAAARHALEQAPPAVRDGGPCLYLRAYHSLRSGDLDEARRLAPSLDRSPGDLRFMAERVDRILARADAVSAVCRLDDEDLRGWHFALSGGLLLHLSAFGVEEMRGRYAFVQDSLDTVRVGIARLVTVIGALELDLARVLYPADPGSEALARAVGTLLEVEVAPDDAGPGLLVSYDLDALGHDALEALGTPAEGRLWWNHALCWTDADAPAPDFVTFLYQSNTAPWEPQMRFDPETQQVVHSDPVEVVPAELAAEILAESASEEVGHPADGLDGLLAIARAGFMDGPASVRERFFCGGGPVYSNRFV